MKKSFTYYLSVFMSSHENMKIRIKLLGFDHRLVDTAVKKIIDIVTTTGAIISGPIPLPTDINRVTLNRSTFVHKTARDQFEIRTHKRLIDLTKVSQKTISEIQDIVLPGGVEVQVKMLQQD
jgi:small subunit ribosomal protein S10